MMKLKKKEETSQDNHFARLPDELLLSILSRMDDLKFLCQCSLVSKRFASTIYQIQDVSLTLPSIEMHSDVSIQDVYKLFRQIINFTGEEIPGLIRSSSIQLFKFSLFLQNFRQLKSIYLEFMCQRNLYPSALLRWKAKYKSTGDMVESIVSLVARSVRKYDENEFDEEQENQDAHTNFSNFYIKDGAFLSIRCCREWLSALCLLLKCHPSLQSVTITDTMKQGKFELRNEQLVEWRKNLFCGGPRFLNNSMPKTSRIIRLRELHLPLSGYLLKGVYFVIMKFTDDDVSTWESEGEEKLIGEALNEILTNTMTKFLKYV